jgi:hypothetical protein
MSSPLHRQEGSRNLMFGSIMEDEKLDIENNGGLCTSSKEDCEGSSYDVDEQSSFKALDQCPLNANPASTTGGCIRNWKERRYEKERRYDCPICLGTYSYLSNGKGESDGDEEGQLPPLCYSGTSSTLLDVADSAIIADASSLSKIEMDTRFLDLSSFIPMIDADDVFTLSQTCQHTFCRSCMVSYVESRLNVGFTEIVCCGPTPAGVSFEKAQQICCGELLNEQDIERLLIRCARSFDHGPDLGVAAVAAAADEINLYGKYKMRQFDNLHGDRCRRCPSCEHPRLFDFGECNKSVALAQADAFAFASRRGEEALGMELSGQNADTISSISEAGVGKPNNGSCKKDDDLIVMKAADNPLLPPSRSMRKNAAPTEVIVNCDKCKTEFCYYHSNAHAGRSCASYEESIAAVVSQTNLYLKENSKPCPRCTIHVEKDGGCNQMKCTHCGCNFCWLCLAEVDDGTFPLHFQWWNLSGCPNMQLQEGTTPQTRRDRFITRAVAFLQLILLGIPSVFFATVSSLLCFCCFLGIGTTNRERSANCVSLWGNILAAVVFSPFAFFGMLAACVVHVAQTLYRALVRGLQHLKEKLVKTGVNDPNSASGNEKQGNGTQVDEPPIIVIVPATSTTPEQSEGEGAEPVVGNAGLVGESAPNSPGRRGGYGTMSTINLKGDDVLRDSANSASIPVLVLNSVNQDE